ncbi:MAG: 2TM domain-containing protein, partial [Chroococcales cyanobacterium]
MSIPENQSLSYSQEDIQQILQRAIARQAYEVEFTRQQLLEIAEELEISPECLILAEQDWHVDKLDHEKRQAFDAYRRGRFKQKLGKYLIINSFLVGLNVLTAGTLSW